MRVLGISCFYHDAAACLVDEGRIVAAATEESFSRVKHDSGFPTRAINYALREGQTEIGKIDAVIYYDKPMKKFARVLHTHLDHFPRGLGPFVRKMPHVISTELRVPKVLKDQLGYTGPVLYSEHHLSHAASAFYCSGWDEASILTVDGVGEWTTSSWGVGRGNDIQLMGETRFPHSLGLLYSAITYYLGFKVNSAEYKVMGLAPYGEPRFVDQVRQLIHVADDGSFRLDMSYFEFERGQRMYNEKLEKLFGQPTRPLEGAELLQFHKDVARSLQVIVDEVMVKLATHIVTQTGARKLCLAGGVALNCVANGEILRRAPVDDIFIQPSAGDAGGAMGAALLLWNGLLKKPRLPRLPTAYLGPAESDAEIQATLDHYGAKYVRLDREELLQRTCDLLEAGKVVGWHHGRMEWGPRALGHRTILGDPRHPEMRTIINMKIKMREGFRPFAPSVLEDQVSEWFEIDRPSPYMLLVAPVKAGKTPLPSITHVDNSARIQTINREQDALYYDLIQQFFRRTGVPVVINTSMNVRGEPMVCTADDTYRCFMRTEMDALVCGPFVMLKDEQPALKLKSAAEEFGLD
ncbi:MAG: carbamoyltransferase [Deltaproteobacteria bacterium]|nr:carbamoyltransferase [Deltaproteobacteria bacterium]